jgi:ribosomal protein S27E
MIAHPVAIDTGRGQLRPAVKCPACGHWAVDLLTRPDTRCWSCGRLLIEGVAL